MCGICGIVDPDRRVDPIARMNDRQRHRGPDDEGYLFVNTKSGELRAAAGDDTSPGAGLIHHKALPLDRFDLALGSRRLAILDLSPAGRMPMAYRGGALWLAYNGEVYNHVELSHELRSLGYAFASHTDTEVILAAYDAWGEDCVRHFNGMFAFALWDVARRRLFCARDHFGIKPFYYRWDGRTLVFASEIKSLLAHPISRRSADEQTIFDYLVGGICDHEERTFFEDIKPLPAGCTLTLDVSSHHLQIRRWWNLAINPALDEVAAGREADNCAGFRQLLHDAVRIRLRSDVAVGTCLSGGLDSSAITCLANDCLVNEQMIPAGQTGNHQKTFTARNRELEIDEYAYSRLIVNQTGAEEHLVTPDGSRLWREIEAFVWHMDEPFSSTSQYPQWNVMRLAREAGVTVLLDGQGGDELLGGYQSYLPLYIQQVARTQGRLRGLQAAWQVAGVGGAPVREMLYADWSVRLPWRLKQMLHAVRPMRTGPGTGGSGLTDSQLASDYVQRYRDRLWQPPVAPADGLAGVLHRDLASTNLPMLLRYEDRNSMAFSVESRLPFLDPRLVSFAFSLPLSYRIRDGWTKWILRKSFSDVLPAQIAWRRSKLGFPTPERTWLADGAAYIKALLDPTRSPFAGRFVRRSVLEQLQQAPPDVLAETPGLWRLVNLELWHQLYFQRDVQRLPVDADEPTRVAV